MSDDDSSTQALGIAVLSVLVGFVAGVALTVIALADKVAGVVR